MSRIYENGPYQDNRKIDNKTCYFNIPSYGQLKMLFLLFDLIMVANTDVNAFNLCEYAELLDNNRVIAKTSAEHSLSKLDRLPSNESSSLLASATKTIGVTEQSITFPLFFWVYDGQMMNTENKNLVLKFVGKTGVSDMRLTNAISTFNVRVRAVYDNYKKVDLDLMKSYNSFMYGTEILAPRPSDPKTVTILLNVNVPVYNVGFIGRTSDPGIDKKINSITLRYPNGNEEISHADTDYTLGSIVGNTQLNYVFNVPFNDYFKKETQLMNMFVAPVRATVVFDDDITIGDYLKIVYEYDSTIVEKSDPALGIKYLMEENNLLY